MSNKKHASFYYDSSHNLQVKSVWLQENEFISTELGEYYEVRSTKLYFMCNLYHLSDFA